MEYQEFFNSIKRRLPVGTVLHNPGGGTSTVTRYTESKMAYRRGDSVIYVQVRAFYDALETFHGRAVTSSELKTHNPRVFDSKSNGHSCNCTTFFMTLQALGIVGHIKGAGRRGDPFRITIPA